MLTRVTERVSILEGRSTVTEKVKTEPLRHHAFNILANQGMVLVEAPGVVATIGIEAAFILSDQLLAACASAPLQRHRALDQAPISGPSNLA
jgi:hypothetical protein